MKVLITGGTGFVGRNIAACFDMANFTRQIGSATATLSAKYGIRVLSVGSTPYDLKDYQACATLLDEYEPDVIVHAAGSVGGILANRENPGKFMYDNLCMGMNMIEATRNYTPWAKFIMLGTVCAYPKFTPVPFKEEDLWNGYPEETNAPYGIAKKALMKLCETYHEQYDMDAINLIPVNMYGNHDHFNLTSSHVIPALILKFYNAMKNGEKTVTLWGTGSASREFLHATDCGRAVVLASNTPGLGPEPINIGTGEEITIRALAEMIADLMNYDGEIEWDTTKPDGQPRRCLDVSRAKQLLEFEAIIPLRDGLRSTIDWFRKDKK